jgi:hypothetical protein
MLENDGRRSASRLRQVRRWQVCFASVGIKGGEAAPSEQRCMQGAARFSSQMFALSMRDCSRCTRREEVLHWPSYELNAMTVS